MKYLIYTFLSFFAVNTYAQDISGIYTGTLANDSLKMTQTYQLALSEYKGKITGYSYITFVSNDTFYYGIKRIKATRENNELIVEDVEMIANNYPKRPDKGVHVINTIALPKQDSILNLNGTWKTTKTKKFYSIGGDLSLRKDSDSSNSALINHLKELRVIKEKEEEKPIVAVVEKKIKPQKAKTKEPEIAKADVRPSLKTEPSTKAAVVVLPAEQRTVKTIETVSTSSDSLILSFYDNGIVDGDTISVYLNDQNILSKAKLTEAAAKKVIYTSSANVDEYKLTLVAENLGTIPPNTGLVIIQDGAQKYQIRFSADMQNNASIIIKKQKKGNGAN